MLVEHRFKGMNQYKNTKIPIFSYEAGKRVFFLLGVIFYDFCISVSMLLLKVPSMAVLAIQQRFNQKWKVYNLHKTYRELCSCSLFLAEVLSKVVWVLRAYPPAMQYVLPQSGIRVVIQGSKVVDSVQMRLIGGLHRHE